MKKLFNYWIEVVEVLVVALVIFAAVCITIYGVLALTILAFEESLASGIISCVIDFILFTFAVAAIAYAYE